LDQGASALPGGRCGGIQGAMTYARLTPHARSLPATVPFVGPETQERERGAPFRARLGANESVFGPSPAVRRALAETEIWKYGDAQAYDLRAALAGHLGAREENVLVGEGIDGLLGDLVRLTVTHGDHVVTSDGAYPTFNYHVAGYGGTLHRVPYDTQDREDIGALFAKAKETDAKLVYLSNPDNPMGTRWTGSEIVAAMEDLPQGTLFVLDEAYVECAPDGTTPNLPWDDPRLIRLRTFSKVYGMAGARIGYALGHPALISAFNKVRNHFGVNRAGQEAAVAALQDEDWLAKVQARIAAARDRIAEIAVANELVPLPSTANFVAIDCGRDGEFAKAVLEGLVARGIFVRMPFAPPQNRCIRVSCGTEADLAAFADVLPQALAAARDFCGTSATE
jgi:histidinol-phosphate aminotransferase